ncbi:hypothetical protein E5676_scaffold590G00020 [Cucumis melo var. makuwa]|uniref:Uncharacterized protein n=1 Tax=Cucumis melo var. makuwa TaxID=1194695 RepID=A0A5D3DAB7_CUCMM|nr:hypothetical protein E6C27_scaffold845G00260 [Cucumis melo var. makuwa]TYK20410.1 hypothetical protein E5676_scaffold590G00020 [Cucumis melo var. makuwa]
MDHVEIKPRTQPSRKPQAEPSCDRSRAPCPSNHLNFLPSTSGHGIRDLTLKFLDPTGSLFGDSSLYSGKPTYVVSNDLKGHNQVSGKGFLTTGPQIEAGNTPMPGCSVYCSYVNGLRCELELLIRASFGITRLIRASFGITRLIRASFGITRLIGVYFEVTRLIRASFGITRLMCAFYRTTRLFMYSEGQTDEGKEGCVKAIWTLLSSDLSLVWKVGSLHPRSLVSSQHRVSTVQHVVDGPSLIIGRHVQSLIASEAVCRHLGLHQATVESKY